MTRRKRDREFWDSAYLNRMTYQQYLDRLTELSMSMFEWKNLPDTVDWRFIERNLLFNGCAIFFNDEAVGYLGLRAVINGPLNVYNIPINRRAIAANGYNRSLNIKNSVIIYNNLIRTNSLNDIKMFARRLADLDRSIDVNAKAQKTPVLVLADEDTRLTMENLYMQYDGNQPFIFSDKKQFGEESPIKVLRTDAPFVADRLYTLKTQLWNEALTYLGISNLNVQKKERLISDEVMRNQGGTIASRYSRLEARRQACNEINKMFGLDIWCDFRDDFREADDEVMFPGDTGAREGEQKEKIMAIDLRTN